MGRPRQLQKLGGDVDRVMATAGSIAEAARTLGIDRSSLTRWIAAGKVTKPRRHRPKARTAPVGGNAAAAATTDVTPTAGDTPTTPATATAWAADIRARYDLASTDEQLVELAVMARTMADDVTLAPSVRLAAAGRYQALVKQLNLELEVDANGSTEKNLDNVRQYPRPVV